MTASTVALPSRERRTTSLALPLVLIALGLLLLLANLGALRGITWAGLFRLWPLLLILPGIDLLLRPRSVVAALAAEIAVIAAAIAYLVTGAIAGPSAALSYSVDVPRGAATDLALTVSYGAGALTLGGGATELVSVRSSREDVGRAVDARGSSTSVVLSSEERPAFGAGERSWRVTLPSDIRTAMTLDLGAGEFDIDLSALKVWRATINAGASDLKVTLPKPIGDVPLAISSGASSVRIVVPPGVEYSVATTGVLHDVEGPTQSVGHATAADRVTIRISIAAGEVEIRSMR